MRIGIIGGSGHYPYVLNGIALRDDMTLTGVARGTKGESIDGLLQACASHGWQPRVYEDWHDMSGEGAVDVIAVNPWFRDTARITAECLRQGIAVYSEKPVATELQDLTELENAWKAYGTDLGCMLDGRHTPWLRTVAKAVGMGAIGEIRLLHGQKSYRMGSRTGVYEKRADYGGMLAWIAIHPLSWFRFLLGSDPVWLSAQTDNRHNRGFGELETTGCILARYDNGILATVDADFYRPDGSARHDDDRIRVTGTKGMLEAIDGKVYLEDDKPRRELPPEESENPFLFFADAIGTQAAKTQAETAFAVARIALLAREAADKGCAMRVR